MDRRTFLGIIPAAALTSRAMRADYAKSDGPIYKGYRIWEWTGWKPAQANAVQVGQWLAAPIDADGAYYRLAKLPSNRPLLMVSVPGEEGPYDVGSRFDISVKRGQRMIDKRTPEVIKERERRKGLRRMFRLIDRTVSQ